MIEKRTSHWLQLFDRFSERLLCSVVLNGQSKNETDGMLEELGFGISEKILIKLLPMDKEKEVIKIILIIN